MQTGLSVGRKLAVLLVIATFVLSFEHLVWAHGAAPPIPPANVNPPIPIMPGHTVEPRDAYGHTWLELDDNGDPLGVWFWCPDVWAWDLAVYNDGVPIRAGQLPSAGDTTRTQWFAGIIGAMVVSALSVFFLEKKPASESSKP